MILLFQLFNFLKHPFEAYLTMIFMVIFLTIKFDTKIIIFVIDAITIGFITFSLIPLYVFIVLILINVMVFGYNNTGEINNGI